MKHLKIFTIVSIALISQQVFPQGLGVNIDPPVSTLHIYENTANTGATAGLTIEQNGAGDAVSQYLLTGGQRWVVGLDNSDADKFKISSSADLNSNARLSILTSGEVGIGTISPPALLSVGANSYTAGVGQASPDLTKTLRFDNVYDNSGNSTANKIIFFSQAGWRAGIGVSSGDVDLFSGSNFRFFTGHQDETTQGTEAFTVLSTGKVGIFQSSPNGALHIFESTGTTTSASAATLILEHDDSGGESGILFKSKVNGASDFAYILYSEDGSGNGSSSENGLLRIGIENDAAGSAWQDDIALMPSGNVGIGTISPPALLSVGANSYTAAVGQASPALDKTLRFDNVYDNGGNSTANKIIFYSQAGWRAGIGISSGDVDLFSGNNFRFFTGHQDETTQGTETMTILGTGRVGILTRTPSQELHVAGDIRVDNNCDIEFKDANTRIRQMNGSDLSLEADDDIFINPDDDIRFRVNGTEYVRFNGGTQRVGIGVTSPDEKLEVNGAIKIGNSVGTNNGTIRYTGADIEGRVGGSWLSLSDNGAQWTDLGSIIHPGEPTADELAIGGTSEAGADIFLGADGTAVFNEQSNSVDFRIESNTNANMFFVDGSANRIGIGTNTPSYTFDVYETREDYIARFFNDGSLQSCNGILIQGGRDSGAGTTYYLRCNDGDGTAVGYLQNSGGVFSLVDPSDIRTKRDVVNTGLNGLNIINNLRVVDFKRIDPENDKIHYGFIAQEAKKVFPYMVSESDEGILGISKGLLVPVLVKAMQEQQAEIDQLRSELESLKQRIENLEK